MSKCGFRPLLANISISLYRITLIFKVPPVRTENSHFQAASLWVLHLLLQLVRDQTIQAIIRMTSTLRTVYHITAFSWYAFIVKSLADKDGEQLPPGIFVYGGPWKYLTFLNLVSKLNIPVVTHWPYKKISREGMKKGYNNVSFNIPVITNVLLWTGSSERSSNWSKVREHCDQM